MLANAMLCAKCAEAASVALTTMKRSDIQALFLLSGQYEISSELGKGKRRKQSGQIDYMRLLRGQP